MVVHLKIKNLEGKNLCMTMLGHTQHGHTQHGHTKTCTACPYITNILIIKLHFTFFWVPNQGASVCCGSQGLNTTETFSHSVGIPLVVYPHAS